MAKHETLGVHFHVDGIVHDATDAYVSAVPLPGGLPFTMVVAGPLANRLLAAMPHRRSGRPHEREVRSILLELRRVIATRDAQRPRFVIATLDFIGVRDDRVELRGKCSIALLVPRDGALTAALPAEEKHRR